MHLACAHLSAINRRLTLLDAILSYLEHTWVAHTAAFCFQSGCSAAGNPVRPCALGCGIDVAQFVMTKACHHIAFDSATNI